VNLFVGSDASIHLPATSVDIVQSTDYPWNGKDEITINPARQTAFAVHIRIPGWVREQPIPGDLYMDRRTDNKPFILLLNGKPLSYSMVKGYAVINRTWTKGDKITIDFPMEVKKVVASDSVRADIGRFALQRGPMVYCLESPDNKDSAVMNIV